LAILARIENGDWIWVGSEVLMDEIEQTPDAQKLSRVKLLSGFVQEYIEIGKKEELRARELQNEGFQVFDALHIACAESAHVDVFLSTDDRLLNLAKQVSIPLKIRVENPLSWIEEKL
jgi:predicted nucleic acid-binding protein